MDTVTDILSDDLKVIKISSTLWEIHDVFTDVYLAALDRYAAQSQAWLMDRPLSRISAPADTATRPFDAAGHALLLHLQQHTNAAVDFRLGKLFLDFPGTGVPLHTDPADIAVMVQVYLTRGEFTVPGTVFMDPTIHTVRFRRNCGYINLNTDAKNHMSPRLTTGIRISLGLQYQWAK